MSRSNISGSNTHGQGDQGQGGYAPAPQHPQQHYHPAPQAPGTQTTGQWRHPLDMEEPHVAPAPQWAPQYAQPHERQHQGHFGAHQPHPDAYAEQQHMPPPAPAHAAYGQQPVAHQGYDQSAYAAQDPYPPQQHDAYGRSLDSRGLASYSPQQGPQHGPQHGHELSTFAPPPHWPQPPAADPRGGYDLGEYAPGTVPQSAHGLAPGPAPGHAPMEPAFSHDPYARPTARTQPPGGWQPQPVQGYPQEPGFAPAPLGVGLAANTAYPAPQAQSPLQVPASHASIVQHQGQPAQPGEDTDEMEFEEEEAPRKGRTLLIVGALVGAIFVGGGLAYTYRALSGGGKTPILTADKSAVKTKADANAQRPPQQAPKLPDVAPKAMVAAEGDATGPRRVATIAVGPDGNTQPMPSPPPAPMAQPQTMTMPGLAVTMPPPMPQREAPQQQQRPQPAPPPVTQAPAPPVQPKVITPPQKQAALPEAQPPPAPKKIVKPKGNDAYVAPGGSAPSTGSGVTSAPAPATKSALGAGGGNGFVAAILSTPKGKMEAMKAFADLQAKYPDALAGKPAEVQEVNLGETKGVWYRAVVGPPGSRSAAAAVCEQLKAAGYTQCFATAY